jgi:hypothetical protein
MLDHYNHEQQLKEEIMLELAQPGLQPLQQQQQQELW